MNTRDKDLQPAPHNPEREKLFVPVSDTREDIREEWMKAHNPNCPKELWSSCADWFLERTIPKSDILAWIEENEKDFMRASLFMQSYGISENSNFSAGDVEEMMDSFKNKLLSDLQAFLSNPNKQ